MSIVLNSQKTLLRQVLSILIQIISITIISRELGVADNGYYAMAMLLPMFLGTIFSMGINSSVIYYIGTKEFLDKNIFTNSNFLVSLIIFFALLIGFVTIMFFSKQLFPNIEKELLYISLCIFPFAFLSSYLLSYIQAKENFLIFNIVSLFNPILLFILILILYFFDLIDIKNVIIIAFIVNFLSSLIILYYVKKEGFSNDIKFISKDVFYKILSFGLKSHISNMVTFINYRADIFLLNVFSNPIAVGLYYVAVQIVERLWIVSSSVSTVLFPRLTRMKENHEKRVEVVSKAFRIVILLTFGASLLLVMFGYYFIKTFFGAEYINTYYIIMALIPGVVFGAGSKIFANAIAAKGKPELNIYTSVITMCVNITLNIILIPKYSYMGAAIATSISYTVNTIMRIWLYNKLETYFKIGSMLITRNDYIYIKSKITNMIFQRKEEKI